MSRVTKISATPSLRDWRLICTADVRLAELDTNTKLRRLAQVQRRGVDPTLCSRKAVYLVDGQPCCLNHAGQKALAILQKCEALCST
jgi:hypothetical protein